MKLVFIAFIVVACAALTALTCARETRDFSLETSAAYVRMSYIIEIIKIILNCLVHELILKIIENAHETVLSSG